MKNAFNCFKLILLESSPGRSSLLQHSKQVQGFLSKTALPPSVCDKSKVHAGQFNSQTITWRAPIKSRLCISDWARPFPRHTQEMFASEWKVNQVSCCCCCFFFKISDTVSFTCYICASLDCQQKNGFITQELYLNVPSFDLHIQKYVSEIIARVSKFDTYKFTSTICAN